MGIDIKAICGDFLDECCQLTMWMAYPNISDKTWFARLDEGCGRTFQARDDDLETAIKDVVEMYKHYLHGVKAKKKLREATEKHGLNTSWID